MASMSSSSQPIALPVTGRVSHAAGSYADYQMADGSYTSSNGAFNPASYTRHFLGSPISWRASSFNAGSFSHRQTEFQFQGSLDTNDTRYGARTCLDSRESILNALNLFDREGELCRNYTCCGLHLNDLHALLEHFESVHIVTVDGDTQNPQMQIPFNPIVNSIPIPPPLETPVAFDPDDMELELDMDNVTAPTVSLIPPPAVSQHSSPSSGAPSPPDTPISTPLSAWPSPHAFRSHYITPASSQPPSPRSKTAAPTRTSSPVSTFRPNLSLNLGGASAFSRAHARSPHVLTNPEGAFNSYARFSSDYSSGLPGAQFNGAPADEASMVANLQQNALWQQQQQQQQQQQHGCAQQQPGCVPPALLFSGSTVATAASTPSGSRVPSPSTYGHGMIQAHGQQQQARQSQSLSVPTTPISTKSTSRPSPLSRTSSATASPSILLSKPFKCPKPNCNKSYKQANGLKYHLTHGSCNFAPPKDLEHVRDLLERKKRERQRERERDISLGMTPASTGANTPTGGPSTPTTELAAEYGITEMDLREVEREAEKRVRPYACTIADCQRRYKNMNGLRYHYQHSGEHGEEGLVALAKVPLENGTKRGHSRQNRNSQRQQGQQRQRRQQRQQTQTQYAAVEEREGKKRLVIRPATQQSQAQAGQVQVQEQGNASLMVPVSVGHQQQQHLQVGQGNLTQIHVTPVVLSPSHQGQGQQQLQHAAVYAGQYSIPHQQQNPYAYACYTASPNLMSSMTSPSAYQHLGYFGHNNSNVGI